MSSKLQESRWLPHDSIDHVEASHSSNHEGKREQDGQQDGQHARVRGCAKLLQRKVILASSFWAWFCSPAVALSKPQNLPYAQPKPPRICRYSQPLALTLSWGGGVTKALKSHRDLHLCFDVIQAMHLGCRV